MGGADLFNSVKEVNLIKMFGIKTRIKKFIVQNDTLFKIFSGWLVERQNKNYAGMSRKEIFSDIYNFVS